MTRKLTDEQVDDMLLAVQAEGITVAVNRVYVVISEIDGSIFGVYPTDDAAGEAIEEVMSNDEPGLDPDEYYRVEEYPLGDSSWN